MIANAVFFACLSLTHKAFCPQENEALNDITDAELQATAEAIEIVGKVSELAEALEIAEYGNNAWTLLKRWLKEMASMGTPARLHLMHHLASIGLPELRAKYGITFLL